LPFGLDALIPPGGPSVSPPLRPLPWSWASLFVEAAGLRWRFATCVGGFLLVMAAAYLAAHSGTRPRGYSKPAHDGNCVPCSPWRWFAPRKLWGALRDLRSCCPRSSDLRLRFPRAAPISLIQGGPQNEGCVPCPLFGSPPFGEM